MKQLIFCVYDSKVQMYMNPFFFLAKGQAIRAWEETVNDPKTQFCRYPADFTLFEIGEWDEATGTIKMHEAKINMGTALDYKTKPTENGNMFPFANAKQQTEERVNNV